MIEEMFVNSPRGFYILKVHSTPCYWAMICAFNLSEGDSRPIMDKYIVWNNDTSKEVSQFHYFGRNVLFIGEQTEEINVMTDAINNHLIPNILPLLNQRLFPGETMPHYQGAELERDLNRDFNHDIRSYIKFFRTGLKQVANHTQCQRLIEDIRMYN